MTKEDLQKKKDEEITNLQRQLLVLQDLENLRNEEFFRQQMLMLMERQARALERLAEDSEIPSEKSEGKDEDETETN